MISVEGLSYQYPSQNEATKKISFPDFKVARGEQFILLGQSGSGKTTLLHLLGGLIRAQQGNIKVEEIDITQLSEIMLDQFRGKQVGFIFQKNHLIAFRIRISMLRQILSEGARSTAFLNRRQHSGAGRARSPASIRKMLTEQQSSIDSLTCCGLTVFRP